MSAREVGLPTSSSHVNSTCNDRLGCTPWLRSACSAKYSSTMPAFHVETARAAGNAIARLKTGSDPACRAARPCRNGTAPPRAVTSPSTASDRCRPRGVSMRRQASPKARKRASTADAKRSSAARSSLGDSISTSRRSSVDHLVAAWLELGPNSGRDLPAARRTRHERIAARGASRTSSRSVRALMRSNSGSKPMPGRSNGTGMAPA